MEFRVGLGQDSHAFDTQKKDLILAGVNFGQSECNGLKGNSDADVILHSICNALSQAIGGRSLATWADKMCLEQGIKDSSGYVKVVFEKVKKLGLKINNLGVMIEAKKPRIEPKVDLMKKSLSQLLELDEQRISITATSGEGLTEFGKGNGIQALTIVSLTKE